MDAQKAPPPEIMQAMNEMENKTKEADARVLDAQTRATESAAKIEMDQAKTMAELQGGGVDQEKMLGLQIQAAEVEQRHQDGLLDAVNRKRDRESRERLAAIKLAEEVMRNPDSLGAVSPFLDREMLDRLQSNEQTLDGKQTGEL
jgi:hypothetical protein